MMLAREGVAALASPARRAKTLDTGSGPKSLGDLLQRRM